MRTRLSLNADLPLLSKVGLLQSWRIPAPKRTSSISSRTRRSASKGLSTSSTRRDGCKIGSRPHQSAVQASKFDVQAIFRWCSGPGERLCTSSVLLQDVPSGSKRSNVQTATRSPGVRRVFETARSFTPCPREHIFFDGKQIDVHRAPTRQGVFTRSGPPLIRGGPPHTRSFTSD